MNAEKVISLSIEDIILSHDRRGISALRPYLSPSYCEEAAKSILDQSSGKGVALITTGFYILSGHAPETDGPPGAISLADALRSLGLEVVFVTDRYAAPLFTLDTAQHDSVIEFPIADHETSRKFARHLLAGLKPSLIISIERCGFSSHYKHLNMMGRDISEYTAKIDYLFLGQENSIGIGDGGNEIGMGNVASHVKGLSGLPIDPAVTQVGKLVIASVSNWGAYGLLAALSQLCKRNLLPSVEWEKNILEELVDRGAVDGVSGMRKHSVDGFNTEENSWALTELNRLLRKTIYTTGHNQE